MREKFYPIKKLNHSNFLMMMLLMLFCATNLPAQKQVEFDGQVSTVFSISPNNDLDWFTGARYLPQLAYKIPMDSLDDHHFFDFEAATNLSVTTSFHPFDTARADFDLSLYRLWARYTGKQFELRMGLQKIDFGSATLLRSLQWFNQIDPRDPLQLTNGVYGLLGRYYFLNNANIWLWGLMGNEKTRGFDVIETNPNIPEFGGRFQMPVPKGEVAVSYHNRTANSTKQTFVNQHKKIAENRIGLDGKWDLLLGIWFEAAFSHKAKDVAQFTNQTLFTLGADYTFGLGNGLNIMAEHLFTSFDETAFAFQNSAHVTALSATYPLSLFDNISTIIYYNYASSDLTFFINFQHQFKYFTGYAMAFYNPETQQGIQQNELVNNFSGPGFRLMFVYNH